MNDVRYYARSSQRSSGRRAVLGDHWRTPRSDKYLFISSMSIRNQRKRNSRFSGQSGNAPGTCPTTTTPSKDMCVVGTGAACLVSGNTTVCDCKGGEMGSGTLLRGVGVHVE